jgi:hypothetical protein
MKSGKCMYDKINRKLTGEKGGELERVNGALERLACQDLSEGGEWQDPPAGGKEAGCSMERSQGVH